MTYQSEVSSCDGNWHSKAARARRPLFEALEPRMMLTSVTGVEPVPGVHDAPSSTVVTAAFDAPIDPATVSADSFAVHAMQSGQLLESLDVDGDIITFTSSRPFHPGELVRVTATTDLKSLDQDAVDGAFVWQFQTAVGAGNGIGTGWFGDSGQRLGNGGSPVAALGDVDGDGDLDAYIGKRNEPDEVWLNDGHGGFVSTGQSLADGLSTATLELGDVNGDGDLDVVRGNYGGSNTLWLNDGSGTFINRGSLHSSSSQVLALGDLDGDGDLDAYFGRFNSFPVSGARDSVWINRHGGNFTKTSQIFEDVPTSAVALGDLDGDGDLDAVVAMSATASKILLNQESTVYVEPEFVDSGQSLGNANISVIELGDADGDGDLDIFFGSEERPGELWLNDGDGLFSDSGERLGETLSQYVTLGDVDGDGDLDAVVGDGQANTVWTNDGHGGFGNAGQTFGESGSRVLALGDLDKDGDLDALVNSAGAIQVWFNANIRADLSITMSDDQHLVVPGQIVNYEITVNNHGPEGVSGATVVDNFPTELNDVSWTCTASLGASCAASGVGDISDLVSIPNQGNLVYTVTGQYDASAAGSITNWAAVVAPGGLQDIGTANNTARDTNVAPLFDVIPQPGSHHAPTGTDVVAAYRDYLDPDTVTADSFRLHASQSSQVPTTSGALNVSGRTILFTPHETFHPGEIVEVTATTEIKNVAGDALVEPVVWRFRTAPVGGTGYFNDSGQSLSGVEALGDVDGDGDLDAVGSSVWLNDGSGVLDDTEQNLDASSVVLGDLDHDGDLDALVRRSRSAATVWFNNGEGEFSESGEQLGSSSARGIALGDLDGDGDLDAFLVDDGPNVVWLNDGTGAFTDSGQLLRRSDSRSVTLGDVDRDGDLDALVGNWGGAGRIWLNDGSGLFYESQQNIDVDFIGSPTALGDLDSDGDLDIVGRRVWLNNGSGVFVDSGQQLNGSGLLGDLDGDGDLDVLDRSSFSFGDVWLNDGDAAFVVRSQPREESEGGATLLGDIDGDGDLDAVGSRVWLNADIPADLSIAVTDGQYHVAPGQSISYTIAVRNEGPADVVNATVANTFPNEMSDVSWTCTASAGAICETSGMGDIRETVSIPAGGKVVYSATGRLQATAAGSITNSAAVMAPNGWDDIELINNLAHDTNIIPPFDVIPRPGAHRVPTATDVVATFDQHIDPATLTAESISIRGTQTGTVVITQSAINVSGKTVSVTPPASFHAGELVNAAVTEGIKNLSGEELVDPFVWQFRTEVQGGTGSFAQSGQELGPIWLTGDLDGDGDLDGLGSRVWLNDGNGVFIDSGQSFGAGAEPRVLGDVDGDGDLDAIGSDVWRNDGNGVFIASGQLSFEEGREIALGDVDGDGDLDALIGDSGRGVWFNDGAGNFSNSGQEFGWLARDVALGDVDGDGDLDAFVVSYSGNELWLNHGAGTFSEAGQDLGGEGLSVAMGDLDGDGDLDAVVGRAFSVELGLIGLPDAVWLNDGSGVFVLSDQQLGDLNGDQEFFESATIDLEIGDLDGDGDLDILVANFNGRNTAWLNDGLGNFTVHSELLGERFHYSVVMGDVDGDGDLDAFFRDFSGTPLWINQDQVRGDNDNNLRVSGSDFLNWQRGFGTPAPHGARADGDVDHDHDVDVHDLRIWEAEFGAVADPTLPASSEAISSTESGPISSALMLAATDLVHLAARQDRTGDAEPPSAEELLFGGGALDSYDDDLRRRIDRQPAPSASSSSVPARSINERSDDADRASPVYEVLDKALESTFS